MIIGMCHSERKENTIDRTMESIRNWNKDRNIIVRAEPNTKKIKGVAYNKNKEQLGCMKNHHQLILDLIDSGEERVLIAQDDFYYAQNAGDIIQETINNTSKEVGYYNFYTNLVYRGNIEKEGRTQLPIKYETAYQVNYLMQTSVLEKVIQHPFYTNHLENYKPNKQVDACISEVLHHLGLPMYFHNPSLSIHIGAIHSTLGHAHRYSEDFNSF